MKKILVAYATMAGSTREVAQAVGGQLEQQGLQVEVRPLGEVKDLAGFDGLVLGGPMILGWHRAALAFLRRQRAALRHKPVAVFVLAATLTQTPPPGAAVPIFVDENLPKPPAVAGKLSLRERYASLNHYLAPILKAARPASPVSVGVFGGRLEYGRLPWWGVLFAMFIIQARAGDWRNWPAIQTWAAGLPEAMGLAGAAA